MTREEVMEQARKVLATQLARANGVSFSQLAAYRKQVYLDTADEFLSRPEILIKDPDQSLPDNPYSEALFAHTTYKNNQEDMLKPDKKGSVWVKALPKEKK